MSNSENRYEHALFKRLLEKKKDQSSERYILVIIRNVPILLTQE